MDVPLRFGGANSELPLSQVKNQTAAVYISAHQEFKSVNSPREL